MVQRFFRAVFVRVFQAHELAFCGEKLRAAHACPDMFHGLL